MLKNTDSSFKNLELMEKLLVLIKRRCFGRSSESEGIMLNFVRLLGWPERCPDSVFVMVFPEVISN
jgi:hypothetical protein